MLVNSRQILTEINNSAHLKEALALVVQRSRSSMDAMACSAFVIDDTQSDQYLLKALLPMVSKTNEIDKTIDLMERAHLDLTIENQVAAKPQIGAMIEVPSAVYLIDALSRRVDFFSIGTNDLTQYLLAVDRNNPHVQNFYDSLHPAVVHVMHNILQKAHHQNKAVGVCGEMAGDPASALLLLGLGIDSLNMNPSSLPRVKWTIRSFTRRQAHAIAQKTLESENVAQTHDQLNAALNEAGLNALVCES